MRCKEIKSEVNKRRREVRSEEEGREGWVEGLVDTDIRYGDWREREGEREREREERREGGSER